MRITFFLLFAGIFHFASGEIIFPKTEVTLPDCYIFHSSEETTPFSNTSDSNVEIIHVEASCGCTVINKVENFIPPKASGSIAFTMRASGSAETQVVFIIVEWRTKGEQTSHLSKVLFRRTVIDPMEMRPDTIYLGENPGGTFKTSESFQLKYDPSVVERVVAKIPDELNSLLQLSVSENKSGYCSGSLGLNISSNIVGAVNTDLVVSGYLIKENKDITWTIPVHARIKAPFDVEPDLIFIPRGKDGGSLTKEIYIHVGKSWKLSNVFLGDLPSSTKFAITTNEDLQILTLEINNSEITSSGSGWIKLTLEKDKSIVVLAIPYVKIGFKERSFNDLISARNAKRAKEAGENIRPLSK